MADEEDYAMRANLSDMWGNGTGGNWSDVSSGVKPLAVVFASLYGAICIFGLVGNGLVIFVVMKYAKMKTVTNMYILNLAVADLCFLIGLPFLINTMMMETWIFGFYMCKIFYILTSINWFTSVFTLTVMSADRYVAVCHAIPSMRYRTPLVSRVICICVWLASLLAMLPIILFTQLMEDPGSGKKSCTIVWPEDRTFGISHEKAFISYAFFLGFGIPVGLISVFYALVIYRLKHSGPVKKSAEKKKSHRRVTRMVLTVIGAYVGCWAPYWVFQLILAFATFDMPFWRRYVFQVITVLSYMNSMLNPLLYAFLSENFRKSFIKAFRCATNAEVNRALHAEVSVYPGRKPCKGVAAGHGKKALKDAGSEDEEEIEFQTTNTFTASTRLEANAEKNGSPSQNGTAETAIVVCSNHVDEKADCAPTAV